MPSTQSKPGSLAEAGNRRQSAITSVTITPVAFADPPLLNTVGVHQPFALRAIVQIRTDAGTVGLGETYADTAHLVRLNAAAEAMVGVDVFALHRLRAVVDDSYLVELNAGPDPVTVQLPARRIVPTMVAD